MSTQPTATAPAVPLSVTLSNTIFGNIARRSAETWPFAPCGFPLNLDAIPEPSPLTGLPDPTLPPIDIRNFEKFYPNPPYLGIVLGTRESSYNCQILADFMACRQLSAVVRGYTPPPGLTKDEQAVWAEDLERNFLLWVNCLQADYVFRGKLYLHAKVTVPAG